MSRFPTCGVVGQLNLSDIEVAGKSYKKEDYFKIFQEAYHYGGLCGKQAEGFQRTRST